MKVKVELTSPFAILLKTEGFLFELIVFVDYFGLFQTNNLYKKNYWKFMIPFYSSSNGTEIKIANRNKIGRFVW